MKKIRKIRILDLWAGPYLEHISVECPTHHFWMLLKGPDLRCTVITNYCKWFSFSVRFRVRIWSFFRVMVAKYPASEDLVFSRFRIKNKTPGKVKNRRLRRLSREQVLRWRGQRSRSEVIVPWLTSYRRSQGVSASLYGLWCWSEDGPMFCVFWQ